MRNLLFLFALIVISACKEEFVSVEVKNADHGVAFIPVSDLKAKHISFDEAVELPIFFVDNPNKPLIAQPLYEGGALTGFLVKSDTLKQVTVEVIHVSHYPEMDTLTNIRFAKKKPTLHEVSSLERLPGVDTKLTSPELQMEGPTWENERVAFRNYFDQRNGMDIFGKRVHRMVLDQVGAPGEPSYHDLQEWGQDILKVGNSLGAGAIALQIGDSLYRIAPGSNGTASILYEGPLQSAVRLQFADWKVKDRVYHVTHDITIQSGTRYYASSVTVDGLIGDENLVTGIVNMDSDSLYSFSGQNEVAFGTFDNQAYSGEKLGMAIALNKKDLVQSFATPDSGEGITQTYAVSMKLKNAVPVRFRFYACWEYEDKAFSSYDGFANFIQSDLN
ncbi:MAG: DUF4861 family protein [Cyclobacteriaceae bacterium]|nr:DUF4861 family protein [Cyclobacteriaceae bacterium SS2]